MVDPNHYSQYHAYYRVGATGVKDHHHHHHQSVESAAQAAAVQTRILEMRKEKSRDAARSRRGKENHEFYELAKMLPLPAAITSQLDKASIIRLTISYLKLRDFSTNGEPSWNVPNGGNSALKSSKTCNVFELHQGTHILQSLDGFAFALGHDGRFLYISETVSIYLGLSQVEMTGSSVFDYTHQQDHAELAEQLGLNVSSSGSHQLSSSPLPPASVGSSASNESDAGTPYTNSHNHITTSGSNDTMERQFCIRMKSTLTKRGCQHFKSSGYRVVHIIAHLRPEMHQRRDSNASTKIIGMVAVAIALPPPSINELRLESDMFVTRLGLDFRIAHCEPRVSDLLNYTSEELIGRNMYSLIHGEDVIQIRKCHLDLIHKGQVMSNYYRIINKSGGFTWMQTCATLICNNSNNKSASSTSTPTSSTNTSNVSSGSNNNEEQEQSIICVNYVLSAIEYRDIVMDTSQLSNGLIANTPTPPTVSINKRTPLKRSHSPTPSPEASHPNTQMTHSQSVDPQTPHNPHTTHASHSSHTASAAPTGTTQAPSVSQANGSPGSPVDVNASEGAKRRRFNSSPVRPWKSPSPPAVCQVGSSPPTNSASNLLRHISVIRETPPILKPQVVSPAYHPHAHHYHHLVDPYAAAYHLYKNGSSSGPIGTQPPPTPAAHHHWGAYN